MDIRSVDSSNAGHEEKHNSSAAPTLLPKHDYSGIWEGSVWFFNQPTAKNNNHHAASAAATATATNDNKQTPETNDPKVDNFFHALISSHAQPVMIEGEKYRKLLLPEIRQACLDGHLLKAIEATMGAELDGKDAAYLSNKTNAVLQKVDTEESKHANKDVRAIVTARFQKLSDSARKCCEDYLAAQRKFNSTLDDIYKGLGQNKDSQPLPINALLLKLFQEKKHHPFFENLIAAKQELVAAERGLDAFCQKTEIYQAYINSIQHRGMSFIPGKPITCSLDALALSHGLPLVVWQRQANKAELTLQHVYKHIGRPVHLIATPDPHTPGRFLYELINNVGNDNISDDKKAASIVRDKNCSVPLPEQGIQHWEDRFFFEAANALKIIATDDRQRATQDKWFTVLLSPYAGSYLKEKQNLAETNYLNEVRRDCKLKFLITAVTELKRYEKKLYIQFVAAEYKKLLEKNLIKDKAFQKAIIDACTQKIKKIEDEYKNHPEYRALKANKDLLERQVAQYQDNAALCRDFNAELAIVKANILLLYGEPYKDAQKKRSDAEAKIVLYDEQAENDHRELSLVSTYLLEALALYKIDIHALNREDQQNKDTNYQWVEDEDYLEAIHRHPDLSTLRTVIASNQHRPIRVYRESTKPKKADPKKATAGKQDESDLCKESGIWEELSPVVQERPEPSEEKSANKKNATSINYALRHEKSIEILEAWAATLKITHAKAMSSLSGCLKEGDITELTDRIRQLFSEIRTDMLEDAKKRGKGLSIARYGDQANPVENYVVWVVSTLRKDIVALGEQFFAQEGYTQFLTDRKIALFALYLKKTALQIVCENDKAAVEDHKKLTHLTTQLESNCNIYRTQAAQWLSKQSYTKETAEERVKEILDTTMGDPLSYDLQERKNIFTLLQEFANSAYQFASPIGRQCIAQLIEAIPDLGLRLRVISDPILTSNPTSNDWKVVKAHLSQVAVVGEIQPIVSEEMSRACDTIYKQLTRTFRTKMPEEFRADFSEMRVIFEYLGKAARRGDDEALVARLKTVKEGKTSMLSQFASTILARIQDERLFCLRSMKDLTLRRAQQEVVDIRMTLVDRDQKIQSEMQIRIEKEQEIERLKKKAAEEKEAADLKLAQAEQRAAQAEREKIEAKESATKLQQTNESLTGTIQRMLSENPLTPRQSAGYAGPAQSIELANRAIPPATPLSSSRHILLAVDNNPAQAVVAPPVPSNEVQQSASLSIVQAAASPP